MILLAGMELASAQPVFHCYGVITQIGTVAQRGEAPILAFPTTISPRTVSGAFLSDGVAKPHQRAIPLCAL